MAGLSNSDKKLLDDVEDYGWHVVKVIGDETGPGFGYSVGLFKAFGHPEVIIIGLNLDLIHLIINRIGENLREGKSYQSGGFYSGLIEAHDCYFATVMLSTIIITLGTLNASTREITFNWSNASILRRKIFIPGRMTGPKRFPIFNPFWQKRG